MTDAIAEQVPLGETEAMLYRLAVTDVAAAVNRLAVMVGTSKALALVSAGVGHIYGAVYPTLDDCGEGPHVQNFRLGAEQGRLLRLREGTVAGTA